jgi:tRNA (cmo5U34)-methyltransferase
MLERMVDFFESRLSGYDEHMLKNIEGAEEFYKYTAEQLPMKSDGKIFDLGCGTGLELEGYFKLNPTAHITGRDLSKAMLNALEMKFKGKNLKLINGSYFEVPFENKIYDAAVSVESLHHFTRTEKIELYKKLFSALKSI